MGRSGFVVVAMVAFVALMVVPVVAHGINIAPFFGEYPDASRLRYVNRWLAMAFTIACIVALVLAAALTRRGMRWVGVALLHGLVAGGLVVLAAQLWGSIRGLSGSAPFLMLLVHGATVAIATRRMPPRPTPPAEA